MRMSLPFSMKLHLVDANRWSNIIAYRYSPRKSGPREAAPVCCLVSLATPRPGASRIAWPPPTAARCAGPPLSPGGSPRGPAPPSLHENPRLLETDRRITPAKTSGTPQTTRSGDHWASRASKTSIRLLSVADPKSFSPSHEKAAPVRAAPVALRLRSSSVWRAPQSACGWSSRPAWFPLGVRPRPG
jgi:hypothetical protein